MKALINRSIQFVWAILVPFLTGTLIIEFGRQIQSVQAKRPIIPQSTTMLSMDTSDMGWMIQTVDTGGTIGYDVSMDLDSQDLPHLSYTYGIHTDPDELRYAWFDDSIWHYETIESAAKIGPSAIKLFTSAGTSIPHVSYTGGDNTFSLRYANREGGVWNTTPIETIPSAWSNSLAINEDGKVFIAYSGTEEWGLKYAYKVTSGGNCRPGAFDWQCDAIDDSSKFASISLALDNDGYAHISYYDFLNMKLNYARQLTGSSGNCGPSNKWQCDVIDNGDDAGKGSSITMDNDDHPIISYYDAYNQALKLARPVTSGGNCGPGNTWSCVVVDDKAAGYRTKIAYKNEFTELIRIAYEYLDSPTALLKLAYAQESTGTCTPGPDWSCDELPFGGVKPTLEIDSKGNSHIAYDNGNLMYARSAYLTYLPIVINLQGSG